MLLPFARSDNLFGAASIVSAIFTVGCQPVSDERVKIVQWPAATAPDAEIDAQAVIHVAYLSGK